MQKSTPVIRTKLLIPKVSNEAIRRMKLTRKLKTVSQYPLTIIHSSAGYGKSTALALFVKDEKQKCCWYSISSSDDELVPFLTYIIASIRTVFPQFGWALLQYIESLDQSISEQVISTLCSNFINEIMIIEDEMILILDDYHNIEHVYTVNRWLEKLLEYIPPNLHLIISCRRKPEWTRLTIMKVQNQLLELRNHDLILTKEEIEILLTDNDDHTVNEEEIKRICQLTEGWILAVSMVAKQIPDPSELDNRLWSPFPDLQDLFQYLAIEVFIKETPTVQQFLEKASVLEIMEGEICNFVLGITNSSTMLEHLTEHNLFIHKIGAQEYRFHPLFKDFLEKQLKRKDRQSYQLLHERCGKFFENGGHWESAFYHYEKMNQMNAIASLLNDYGLNMLRNGELEILYDRLKSVSRRVKNSYYRLWFLEGEILRLRSLYKEAENCYDVSIALAEQNKDDLEMSKALEGKAKIYLDTIQPYKAERLLYKAIEIRENSEKKNKETELGELYRLLAENSINYGQMKKGEKWIQKARELNAPLLDGNLEARLYLRTGRFRKAKWILLASKRNQKDKSLQLPQSHRETDLLLSLIEAFIGNGAEAKSLAQDGIQLGIKLHSPFMEACGWIRMGHSVQLLSMYDSTIALKCYETALTMMDDIKVDRGKAEPLMGICLLYGCRGEFEKAIDAGNRALQVTEKVNDSWLASMITLSMGIAALYSRQFVEGEELLRSAEKLFLECEDEYGRTLLLFWSSYLFYERNEKELFRKNMTMFLKRVQMGSYEFLFHKRTLFGPRDLQLFAPLLIEANKQKMSPYYVPKLLQELNLAKLDSHPGYSLRIQTLGTFRVWLGEKELIERDWQRGKAKELLQLFVTKFGQPLSKEDIFELLWPGQDEKSCARDLKVALNALNNALEPERKARSSPFFIHREGSSYSFNQGIGLELDVLIFEEWVQAGLEEKNPEKSIQLLLKGLTLYKGDYLPERKYDDWCLNTREKLFVLFLRGAEKLAQLSVSALDYNQAIYWCEQIIEKDYTWEEAYRLLMFCYFKKNNRPFAIKWYKKCCDILESEIGVQPLESTQQMYKMIMESG